MVHITLNAGSEGKKYATRDGVILQCRYFYRGPENHHKGCMVLESLCFEQPTQPALVLHACIASPETFYFSGLVFTPMCQQLRQQMRRSPGCCIHDLHHVTQVLPLVCAQGHVVPCWCREWIQQLRKFRFRNLSALPAWEWQTCCTTKARQLTQYVSAEAFLDNVRGSCLVGSKRRDMDENNNTTDQECNLRFDVKISIRFLITHIEN